MNQTPEPMSTAEAISLGLDRTLGDLGVEVFSAPHQVGDRVVITASAHERSGGFGFGGGGGVDDGANSGGGFGGGGGGSSVSRPVAVIEVTPEGVTVRPIVDITRLLLALAGILLSVRRFRRR